MLDEDTESDLAVDGVVGSIHLERHGLEGDRCIKYHGSSDEIVQYFISLVDLLRRMRLMCASDGLIRHLHMHTVCLKLLL